jgi:hypothetical protein
MTCVRVLAKIEGSQMAFWSRSIEAGYCCCLILMPRKFHQKITLGLKLYETIVAFKIIVLAYLVFLFTVKSLDTVQTKC